MRSHEAELEYVVSIIAVLTQVDLSGLELNLEKIWSRLRYPNSVHGNPAIQEIVHHAIEIGRILLQPAACFRILLIKRLISPTVEIADSISFTSRDLVNRCRGATELAAFIVTIGADLKARVGKLFQSNNPTIGYILRCDRIGSHNDGCRESEMKAARLRADQRLLGNSSLVLPRLWRLEHGRAEDVICTCRWGQIRGAPGGGLQDDLTKVVRLRPANEALIRDR